MILLPAALPLIAIAGLLGFIVTTVILIVLDRRHDRHVRRKLRDL